MLSPSEPGRRGSCLSWPVPRQGQTLRCLLALLHRLSLPFSCNRFQLACDRGGPGGTQIGSLLRGCRAPPPPAFSYSGSNYKAHTLVPEREPQLSPYPTTTPHFFLGIPTLFSRRTKKQQILLREPFRLIPPGLSISPSEGTGV